MKPTPGSMITFRRPDGQEVSGYLATPHNAEGAPAIVVIQEWWGLNDQILGVADRLAQSGYLALVPDLYRGKATAEEEEAHHLMTGLDFGDAASQDIRGAVQYLKQRTERVGVTGFCMGGRISFLTACKISGIKAAAPFYGGGIGGLLEQAPKITCPLLLFFGDQDPFIPNQEVTTIKSTLAKLNKTAEVVVYPGAPHGFFCNERDSYRPDAAKDAWERLKAFFKKHLAS